MSASSKAKDASIAAKATEYHDGPHETKKLNGDASNAHLEAARAWSKVGGEEGKAKADEHNDARMEHNKKWSALEARHPTTAPKSDSGKAEHKTTVARMDAKEASAHANETGRPADHAAAAEAHVKAIRAMSEGAAKHGGGPRDDDPHHFEPSEYKAHNDAIREHDKKAGSGEGNRSDADHYSGVGHGLDGPRDKAKGGGGGDDHPRDEHGRFASK